MKEKRSPYARLEKRSNQLSPNFFDINKIPCFIQVLADKTALPPKYLLWCFNSNQKEHYVAILTMQNYLANYPEKIYPFLSLDDLFKFTQEQRQLLKLVYPLVRSGQTTIEAILNMDGAEQKKLENRIMQLSPLEKIRMEQGEAPAKALR